ncbi:GNAT family N-acetyltransferase [Candidatus Woesearchaeota archaeon]|nr:GNAT family N-acetyltransferase [Candidatus Woesearchaeota archaeon]
MLSFEELNQFNWFIFEDDILGSEQLYPESIRSTAEEFLELLNTPAVIALTLQFKDKYIGNIIGCPLSADEIKEFGLETTITKHPSKIMYLFNYVIDKNFQGNGYGQDLLLAFCKIAKQRGYETVMGHFRKNESLLVAKKLCAEEKKAFPNWENTGEEYILCELDLNKIETV